MSQAPDSEAVFKKKSRTFSLAAKLFAAEDRQAISRLYGFCRATDDFADATQSGEGEQLDRVLADLSVPAGGDPHPVAGDFLALARERDLPIAAARALVLALREDCGPRQIESESELIRFAFGVAGTVGLLICPVLNVKDRRASAFAVDLGIAFQLTNIARDVAEDAGRERFYLPASWVLPEEIERARLGEAKAVVAVDRAVEKLLGLAEDYYSSALSGMYFIPRRNRRAIFMATMLYRQIGRKLLQRGSGAWRERIVVGGWEKAATVLASWPRYRRLKRGVWARAEPPVHASSLDAQLKEAGIDLSAFSES